MDYILSNQELFAEKGITMNPGGYVHPTFLYESLWCLVGFAILYVILRKFRRFSGQIFLCYGIWYGTGRAIFEGLRTDSLYIGDTTIRVSQLLSAVVVVAFAAVLVAFLIKFIKHPEPIEGVDFFPEGSRIPKSERIPKEITEETEVENNGRDN